MFEKGERPLICCTIKGEDAERFISRMQEMREQGAEAFLLRLEYLLPENRTEDTFRRICEAAEGLPLYATDYRRFDKYADESDEIKAEALLTAARAGADLLDVPGNMFTSESFELTFDPEAVAKQKELITRIHALGKKVLMSTHVLRFLPAEEVLRIAREQQARGADVVKIVTGSGTEYELAENLRIAYLLKDQLSAANLFLSAGPFCRLHRIAGPYLGACMWLATFEPGRADQPLISILKPILDNMNRC